MRKETLTLLTCFDQPALESQAVESTTDTKLSDAKEDAQPPKELLSSLLRVELMHSTASLSRSAPVAIENLRTAFEFKKVPRQLVAPAVRCLLGFLNIRLVFTNIEVNYGVYWSFKGCMPLQVFTDIIPKHPW